jgi:hypothetical protein
MAMRFAETGSQQPNTDRATRCAEEKRGDMRFVPERRRSRRAARRGPRGASASELMAEGVRRSPRIS